jgi:nucleoid DNA-binding protein
MARRFFRQELLREIAELTGHDMQTTEIFVRAFQTVIEQRVAEGRETTISGFLKVHVYRLPPRRIWNPRTGEYFVTKGRRKVRLNPGSGLLRAARAEEDGNG